MSALTIKQLESGYNINGVKLDAIEWGVIMRLAKKCNLGVTDAGTVEKPAGTKGKPASIYNVPAKLTIEIMDN